MILCLKFFFLKRAMEGRYFGRTKSNVLVQYVNENNSHKNERNSLRRGRR
jgi:hypothetical protein